jgi:hypothetical protein
MRHDVTREKCVDGVQDQGICHAGSMRREACSDNAASTDSRGSRSRPQRAA